MNLTMDGPPDMARSTSLYVGDLHPDVTDSELYDAFSELPGLDSFCVCLDLSTRRSLGYGYVDFFTHEDAVHALEVKNHSTIHGKHIRVSWSQRDPNVRRNGAGNVFIENLNDTIDSAKLQDMFQNFGNIISCKVAVSEDGTSKGYGFVQFETEESANAAIENINGSVYEGKQMYVKNSDQILENLDHDISEELLAFQGSSVINVLDVSGGSGHPLEQMQLANYNGSWSGIANDVLELILSRLVAGDYFVFRAVCKNWGSIQSPPHPRHHSLHGFDSPGPCSPSLLTKRPTTFKLFHPMYNLTQSIDFPEGLEQFQIRCARRDWLLLSVGKRGLLFYNPISKLRVQLPDLPEAGDNASYQAWTFSCPPDSSIDCQVVGFCFYGRPPPVFAITVGDPEWKHWSYYELFDEDEVERQSYYPRFMAHFRCNPIFVRNCVFIVGLEGELGILRVFQNVEPAWAFHTSPFCQKKRETILNIYVVEDCETGGILVVFVTEDDAGRDVHVWRYTVNHGQFEAEPITSLDGKTLFVSPDACYLKPCVAAGLGNKIYFPMFHGEHDDHGVFYCLDSRRFYSFSYSGGGSCLSSHLLGVSYSASNAWIELEPNVLRAVFL